MAKKFFRKYTRLARDLVGYLVMFYFKDYEDGGLEVIKIDRADHLLAAKRLHAEVYLRRNFVTESDIEAGMLTYHADPHQYHAQYFAVIDRRSRTVVATCRQIKAHPQKGMLSFPIMEHVRLHEQAVATLEGQQPSACVEASGFAKQVNVSSFAPLLIWRAMWHDSLRQRHGIMFLACDVRLFERMSLLFGPGIQKAGPVTPYQGGDVVPAILEIQSSVSALKKAVDQVQPAQRIIRQKAARFLLHGIPAEALSASELQAYYELTGKTKKEMAKLLGISAVPASGEELAA
jgi:hypothetical protein